MVREIFKTDTCHKYAFGCFYAIWVCMIIGMSGALSSCVQEIAPRESRTGNKIEIRFRLAAARYDDTPDSENRIAQRNGAEPTAQHTAFSDPMANAENVVVALGDDWVAAATLTEDRENVTLRAKTSGTAPLTAGTRLIIAAYEKDKSAVAAEQAEYMVNSDGSITPTGGVLWLTENVEYRFAAYTYDTSVVPDPANIDPAKDLLWGCFPEPAGTFHTVTPTSSLIAITLEHLFSEVKVKFKIENGKVSAISNVTMTGKPTSTVTLDVLAGTFTGTGNTGHTFNFDPFSPTDTITSKPAIAWTVDKPQVNVGSITVEGKTYTNRTFSFDNTTLEAGNSYTLTAGFSRVTYIVSPADVNLGVENHTPAMQTVTVTPTPANGPWTLTSSQPWVQLNTDGDAAGLSEITGTGSQTVYLVTDENLNASPRTAVIYINNELSDERVTVTQEGVTLSVSQTSLNCWCRCSQSTAVTTNYPSWYYSISGANAADFNIIRSGYTLTVTPNSVNTGSSARTATITITAGNRTQNIILTQSPLSDVIPNVNSSARFNYSGNYQTFTAVRSGNYRIQLWGASGGQYAGPNGTTGVGGRGGYTSGTVYLTECTTLYVYVGNRINTMGTTPFNGGGAGRDLSSSSWYSAAGGGATDVRFWGDNCNPPTGSQLNWNNATGLNHRIMVAAGGGGGSIYWHYSTQVLTGGYGGGLNGGNGYVNQFNTTFNSNTHSLSALGGNQIGGSQGDGLNRSRVFGGGSAASGGGYYGGVQGGDMASGWVSGGAGGSSFISGHPGCNAITSATNRAHTGQPNHFSGLVFNSRVMTAGNASMPNPNGGTMTGNTGNGVAIITYIGP